MERLLLLLPEDVVPTERVDAFFMPQTAAAAERAFGLARTLRQRGLKVELAAPGKMNKQFTQAERLKARFALIMGDDEMAAGMVTVKDLDARSQSQVTVAELTDALVAKPQAEVAL
jgi:histidyl-tRNA synthetase